MTIIHPAFMPACARAGAGVGEDEKNNRQLSDDQRQFIGRDQWA